MQRKGAFTKRNWDRAQREKDEKVRQIAREEAARAAKSEALHAEIQASRAAKVQRDVEIKKHMAKHKNGLRQAKPRLSKETLRAAGAAFAEKHKGCLVVMNSKSATQDGECDVVVVDKGKCNREEEGVAEGAGSKHIERVSVDCGDSKNFPRVEIYYPAQGKIQCIQEEGASQQPLTAVCPTLPAKPVSVAEASSQLDVVDSLESCEVKMRSLTHNESSDDIGLRIETLRVSLENKIGEEKFIKVYKYLRRIGASDDDPQTETQGKLEGLLGKSNIQYAFLIHKLLMLEDSLY